MAGASRCLSSLLFPHPGLRPPLPAGRGWLARLVFPSSPPCFFPSSPPCREGVGGGGTGWGTFFSLSSRLFFPPPRPAATPPCREGMAGGSRCLSLLFCCCWGYLRPLPAGRGGPVRGRGGGYRLGVTFFLVSSFPHPGLRPPLPAGRGWLAHHAVSHYYSVAAGGIFVPSLQGGVAPSGVGVGV